MSHPPHLLGVGTSALIPFCAFKSDPIISDNPQWIQGLSFPVCSSFQQTILEDQLCYKLQLNRRSGVGKKNQLLLLLDYNEDLSMQVRLNSSDSMLEPTRLNMEQKGAEEGTKAKIQVNTLSPIIGFGGGSFKLTAVKRMTVSDDFLKMSLDDRDCEVELYEDCRTWNLIQECGCAPSEMTAVQVCQALRHFQFTTFLRRASSAPQKAEIALRRWPAKISTAASPVKVSLLMLSGMQRLQTKIRVERTQKI